MSERNYYDILGLTADADGIAVNRTYWQLARKYQALAPSDPRAHGMLDELNEAYGVLGTPALRDQYDATLKRAPGSETEDRTQPLGGTSGRSWSTPAPVRETPTDITQPRTAVVPLVAFAVSAALTAAAASAGLWSGNLLIEGLAGSGAIALGVVAARYAFGRMFRARRSSRARQEGADVRSARVSERQRSNAEPLSASIVRRRGGNADDLRTSTASMVGRWRAKAPAASTSTEPDLTLVDIFRSEQEIESQSEPLSAVLDVLRGSRNPVESR